MYDRCSNYNVLSGHKNAVLEVKWTSSGSNIVSCSADKTVVLWDANRGTRVRKMGAHTAIVNCCAVAKDAPNAFASGSDDCTVIVWDQRSKRQVHNLYHDYQVRSLVIRCAYIESPELYTHP
jgi:Prp8 binding protein